MRCPSLRGAIAIAALTASGFAAAPESVGSGEEHAATSAESGRVFSIVLNLEGLPAQAAFMPVTTPIDLTQVLAPLGSFGTVDERSLRLFTQSAENEIAEIPLQFTPAPQPRLSRRPSPPGTVAGVSYLGEYPASETPRELRVAGELSWMARADANGRAQYRLEFATTQTGRAIQVPFPPQNVRLFDREGRATPVRWFPEMQIRPQWPMEGEVQILEQSQRVTSYHLGPLLSGPSSTAYRRPFLYPVNGPDGVSLTEFGKSHDPTGSHAHHYSLWIAHAQVNGTDFWSEKGGVIAHENFEELEDGPLFCRLVQNTRWMNGAAVLLRDRRELKVYKAAPGFRLMDLDLQLQAGQSEPVTFGKTSFGFLAARVAQSMTVFDGGGEIVNAKGDRNEQQAHLQAANWIDQSGPISAETWNGIALFDHPENPNHPTGWHCRNDGWVGAAFNMTQAYVLQPGRTLRLRYRVHLHRHNAAGGDVARRYAEYAAIPVVRLGEVTAKQSDR